MRESTLPYVLTEYLSHHTPVNKEYEEEQHSYNDSHCEEKTKSKRAHSNRIPSREKTSELLKKQRRERHERQYDNWQEVKILYKDEQSKQFQKRSNLQKQLIQGRDNLRLMRIQEQQLERQKLKEAERQAKQAQIGQLENICRLSLDEDKEKRKRSLRQRKKNSDNENISNNASSLQLRDKSPVQSSLPTHSQAEYKAKYEGSERMPTDLPVHPVVSGPLHHLNVHAPPTPVYEGAEDEEELESSETEASTRTPTQDEAAAAEEELPWHHQQLYRLYGKQADQYLHPKFEDKKKTIISKPINPKLRQPGVKAGDLWTELRQDSRMKLLKEDSNIPTELKGYRMMVFSRISGWVPDLDILMDQSKIKGAQDFKHKCEIMYRASHMNEDKSRVLMFNNPVPDLNNWNGQESCARYMPSWIEAQSENESELSYKKWLPESRSQQVQKQEMQAFSAAAEKHRESPQLQLSFLQGDLKYLTSAQTARQPKPKYLFLTEREARCKGEFSQRYKDAEDLHTRPQEFSDPTTKLTAQSAMAILGGNSSRTSCRTQSASTKSQRRSQSELSNRYISKWQPLSIGALVEYKHNMKALGDGDFSFGKIPTWKVQSSPA